VFAIVIQRLLDRPRRSPQERRQTWSETVKSLASCAAAAGKEYQDGVILTSFPNERAGRVF